MLLFKELSPFILSFFSKITVVELLSGSTSNLRNRRAWQPCSSIVFHFARVWPLIRKVQNFFKSVNLNNVQGSILKSEPKCQCRLSVLSNMTLQNISEYTYTTINTTFAAQGKIKLRRNAECIWYVFYCLEENPAGTSWKLRDMWLIAKQFSVST